MRTSIVLIIGFLQSVPFAQAVTSGTLGVAVAEGYRFADGPAADAAGNLYFCDDPANTVYRLDAATGKTEAWLENSGAVNGLFMGKDGKLYGSQRSQRRLVSIDPATKAIESICEGYDGKLLNTPNDVWADPKGGVYFTDTVAARMAPEQGGEFAYYVAPERAKTIRVTESLKQINGIVGTADGKKLYVTARTGGAIYVYDVQADGTLANKKEFAAIGSDGMTLDAAGNLYITPYNIRQIWIYNPAGERIGGLDVPEMPSNVEFAGKRLMVTARTKVYAYEGK